MVSTQVGMGDNKMAMAKAQWRGNVKTELKGWRKMCLTSWACRMSAACVVYLFVCFGVSVCACVRACTHACVCVCVCVCMYLFLLYSHPHPFLPLFTPTCFPFIHTCAHFPLYSHPHLFSLYSHPRPFSLYSYPCLFSPVFTPMSIFPSLNCQSPPPHPHPPHVFTPMSVSHVFSASKFPVLNKIASPLVASHVHPILTIHSVLLQTMVKPVALDDSASQHRKGSILRAASALAGGTDEREDITYTPLKAWTKQPTTQELIHEKEVKRERFGWEVDFPDFQMPFQKNIATKMAEMDDDEWKCLWPFLFLLVSCIWREERINL